MKRILVIDDDVEILEALEAMLDMEGFEVTISTRADVVKRITDRNEPDIIIMDVLLSGEDGRDVCKKLKSRETTKSIPLIMISAHPNIKASVFKAGADAFLPKPFDAEDLVKQIKLLVRN